jgi:hypothetical protein
MDYFRAIIENASGKRTIRQSILSSIKTLLTRPHAFVFSKPFALIFVRDTTLLGGYILSNKCLECLWWNIHMCQWHRHSPLHNSREARVNNDSWDDEIRQYFCRECFSFSLERFTLHEILLHRYSTTHPSSYLCTIHAQRLAHHICILQCSTTPGTSHTYWHASGFYARHPETEHSSVHCSGGHSVYKHSDASARFRYL